ncbi:MAG: PDZ domain-containing protein [Actinobacteria bacterium]|nr:PDZ domain-containing protein [Actinomycetota bacterium]
MTGLGGEQDEGPGERNWFHPSELPADPVAPRPARAPRPWAGVAIGAGLIGALGGFGMTVVLTDNEPSNPDREARATVASTMRTLAPLAGSSDTAAAQAVRASAAVLPVSAWSGSKLRSGSAVVFRSDGVLVTSAAVVGGATTIEVEIADGQVVEAIVTGVDSEYDLALLETEATGLNELEFAAPRASPRPGDSCVLVGAGDDTHHGRWAAAGVIAATGRVVEAGGHWMIDVIEVQGVLEQSAPGGALLAPDGELLGILTSARAGAGSNGVLVVPASQARRSVEQILDSGRARHAWLGLATADATDPVRGALVREVAQSGPAAGAGIQPDDVVVRLGREAVRGMVSLMREVRRHEIGETVNVGIVRDGEELELTVTLAPRP